MVIWASLPSPKLLKNTLSLDTGGLTLRLETEDGDPPKILSPALDNAAHSSTTTPHRACDRTAAPRAAALLPSDLDPPVMCSHSVGVTRAFLCQHPVLRPLCGSSRLPIVTDCSDGRCLPLAPGCCGPALVLLWLRGRGPRLCGLLVARASGTPSRLSSRMGGRDGR
jgi:hypothetical protein